MPHRSLIAKFLVVTLALAALCAPPAGTAEGRPRLVVVVVVDQLRGDLPARAASVSPGGGFERILKGGVVYDQAYYEHATTATAPGHATLFTGAYPSQHGIVGNEWYERDAKQRTTSVTSPAHGQDIGPYNLRSTTVGDELRLACGARCRVFGVSGKDRGAVLPAGHVGKAFWFDTGRGGFRSSAYYAALPDWVSAWNAAIPKSMYPAQWTLLREPSAYPGAAADDRPFERPPPALGKTFPHALGEPGDAGYYNLFLHTPFVDALTLAFVRELVQVEGLGRNDTPDLLSVSLSATDYVGHSFGPESLESADNLARLDRELDDFIGFLDERVGRERYLLVLTADHGLGATPEYAATLGFPAQRVDADSLAATVNRELATRLRVPSPAVSAFLPPELYLDRAKLAAAGVALKDASAVAAEVLRSQVGVAYAFTNGEFAAEPAIGALVRNSVYEPRSGDVYVVAEPESAIVEGLTLYTAYHGTPYAADRYVPLYFFGAGVPAQRIDRNVSTRSLAPTLAAVLGVPAPSHAAAPVLTEVAGAVEVGTALKARERGPRLTRPTTRSQASSRGATAR
jgi:predicted AlkP superfamily pyrophosphatase or phosphodiesterase